MKKLEGEATANNRKGKLIFLYEWNIKCVWEGTLKYDTDKHEGRIEIPNLSDENGADELDVSVWFGALKLSCVCPHLWVFGASA